MSGVSSKHIVLLLLFIILFLIVAPLIARGGGFLSDINYNETISLILDETDLNQGGWNHHIDWITCSQNGNKVAFWTMAHKVGAASVRHMYVMDADGSHLKEITPAASINPRWPRLNRDGTRMFFASDYHNNISYIDTSTGTFHQNVVRSVSMDFRHPFEINAAGTKVTFMHDDITDRDCDTFGIYTASVPGTPTRVLGLHELPASDYCNANRLAFLGAADDGTPLVRWKNHDFCGNCTALFEGSARVPGEWIEYVYGLQDLPNRIITRDGRWALYHRGVVSGGGTSFSLQLVDLSSGTMTRLFDGDVERPSISPTGNLVRFNAPLAGRATIIPLANGVPGQARDTLSYHTTLIDAWNMTDIAMNGTRWFAQTSQDFGARQKIYRVDLNPDRTGAAAGQGPVIHNVSFNANMLLKDDTMRITAAVFVTDPQNDLDWVRLDGMVEYGRENVEWDTIGRAPLSAGGDSSGAPLTDDGPGGDNGDEIAGDQVYTCDDFHTRSNCDFWSHYASRGLPIKIPLRIVAKDRAGNYTIAETELGVTDNAGEITFSDSPGDGGTPDPGDGGSPDPGDGGTPDPGDGGTPDPGDGGTPSPGDGGTPNPGDGNPGDSNPDANGGSTDTDGAGLDSPGALCPVVALLALLVTLTATLRTRSGRW